MPIDPFGLIGSAIANVVTDSLTAAMLALWNAGLWVLRAVLELEDAILAPSLGEDGPVGELYATTFWIALALVGILMLVQIGVALGKRDGHSIGRLLVGAAQFGFVWFAWVGYGVTLVAACSGLRVWPIAAIQSSIPMMPRMTLLVLAAVTPIAAAGLVTDFGRGWFWKSFRWFHAAALTPPLMVLALGIGVRITTEVAVGGEDDVLKSIGTAFVGVVLICVSSFSPLALYKLFAFTDPGSTSGSALRAGIAAAGGIGGVLAGRQTGSSAATTTDEAGRTAGEDGAAATTIGRFAAGMGPAGQAFSAGIGVMAAVGGAAAAMGADETNQMGVGHNNFPPDYSRRGVRAGSGESGYDDGTTDTAANPDVASGGWGGPSPDAGTSESGPGSGATPSPGMPAPTATQGATAARGAASTSEIAEVAQVAAL